MKEKPIIPGLTFTATQIVTPDTTASHYGSGLVEVYATPAMVALMEKAAMLAVLPYLPEGFNTVGIQISVNHTKATPLGMEVKSIATLLEVVDKKLLFEVVAFDSKCEIGRGTHTRYIINSEQFMNKVKNL